MAEESTQSSSKIPPVPPVMHLVPTKPADSAGNELVNRSLPDALNPDDRFLYATPPDPLSFGEFSAIGELPTTLK